MEDNQEERRMSSDDNTVTLTLKNNADVTYIDIPETEGTVVCKEGTAYTETVSCPAIDSVTNEETTVTYDFDCPASGAATYTYTCPASCRLPKCQTYDSGTG